MKKGFTLIELLAVLVILAIVSLISTPLILNIINDSKRKSFEVEMNSIEKAAEYYLTDGFKFDTLEKYKDIYIPVTTLKSYISNYKDSMDSEFVIVKKTDSKINYYYTGRDDDLYSDNKALKDIVEEDSVHIKKNIKVNGTIVNKVIGTKAEKQTIKNWVWFSGQLWQVLETTDNYVKLITSNSVTSISYGATSTWSTSWARKWLNEIDSNSNQDGIFYNNLSRKDLLLDGNFCLDEPTSVTEVVYVIDGETRSKVTAFTPINTCSSIASDKVGLMTFEDYVYSLNGVDGITGALGNSYIDVDEVDWTMTKYTVGGVTTKTWHTYYKNPSHIERAFYNTNDFGKAVRPVIYLSSNLKIVENSSNDYGTINNPFKIIGDDNNLKATSLSGVTIGSYIYLDESNNPYTVTTEYVTDNINYAYDKTKVRYRVIGINSDGTVRVERTDILRNLPSSISTNSDWIIPYFYKANLCDSVAGVFTECRYHCYYESTFGNDSYAYTDGENIGYYLNNTVNGYYTWLSQSVKNNVIITNWNLPISAHANDYATSLFNFDYSGTFPTTRTNDGVVSAYVGLPTWGDMFTGNDINVTYWYINRYGVTSTRYNSVITANGNTWTYNTSDTIAAVRPILTLKADIRIISGDGTTSNPYSLLLN